MIERSHYRQSPINDPVSALVLDRFIEQLDGFEGYMIDRNGIATLTSGLESVIFHAQAD